MDWSPILGSLGDQPDESNPYDVWPPRPLPADLARFLPRADPQPPGPATGLGGIRQNFGLTGALSPQGSDADVPWPDPETATMVLGTPPGRPSSPPWPSAGTNPFDQYSPPDLSKWLPQAQPTPRSSATGLDGLSRDFGLADDFSPQGSDSDVSWPKPASIAAPPGLQSSTGLDYLKQFATGLPLGAADLVEAANPAMTSVRSIAQLAGVDLPSTADVTRVLMDRLGLYPGDPKDFGERLARGVGEALPGAAVPEVGGASLMRSLVAQAVAGASGTALAELVPDEWKPLAQMIGTAVASHRAARADTTAELSATRSGQTLEKTQVSPDAVTARDADILRRYGFTDDQIGTVPADQRAARVAEAIKHGISPENPENITDGGEADSSPRVESVTGAPKDLTGSPYDIVHEFRLDPADVGRSRSVHENRGNASLDAKFKSNPEYAASREEEIPGIRDAVSSVGGRTTPGGYTWHHHPANVRSVELISQAQHKDPTLQDILHPNRRGGYANWEVPEGAPKR